MKKQIPFSEIVGKTCIGAHMSSSDVLLVFEESYVALEAEEEYGMVLLSECVRSDDLINFGKEALVKTGVGTEVEVEKLYEDRRKKDENLSRLNERAAYERLRKKFEE